MAKTMRAVVKTAPGRGGELREVPRPEPGQGEALVRIKAASICGTDHHIYDWNHWAEGRIGPRIPQTMGHEFCGFVEELGPGADRVANINNHARGWRRLPNEDWTADLESDTLDERGPVW